MTGLRVALATLALLVVSGCGSGIESGYVTRKVYHPAYWQTTYNCVAYDKNGFCTLQVPITTLQPEQFELKLREDDKTGYVYVDGATYHRYETNSHYPDAR